MPLTVIARDDAWTRVTSTAGARIGLRVAPQPSEQFVEIIAAVDDPGAANLAGAAGDDAWVISSKEVGVPFYNLGTAHLWVRARGGRVKVYASEKILPAS